MAGREKLQDLIRYGREQLDLVRYNRDFAIWFNDFRNTDTYAAIVGDYKECSSEIFEKLNRFFTDTVWNQRKLKNEASTQEDVEQDTH